MYVSITTIITTVKYSSSASSTFSSSLRSSPSLLPSTRRRLSFRSNRTCHFYDIDGTENYDADEQCSKIFILFPTLLQSLKYCLAYSLN